MTAKEWAQKFIEYKQLRVLQPYSGEIIDFTVLQDEVEITINWAIEEEREACARIAELSDSTNAGADIAERIRARSNS